MAQLEAEIQKARGQIAQAQALIDEEERQLRMLEPLASQLGLHSAEGERLYRALRDEIAAKQRTLQALRRLLEAETQRLWRLEETLRLRPQR